MEIKAKIKDTETEVPVILTDEQVKQVAELKKEEIVNEVILEIIKQAILTADLNTPSLDDDEVEDVMLHVQEHIEYSDPEHFASSIISHALEDTIRAGIDEVIKNRVSYFTYQIPYDGTLEVCIKAHNQDEAEYYLDCMNDYELQDLIEAGEIDMCRYSKKLIREDAEEPYTYDGLDATDE